MGILTDAIAIALGGLFGSRLQKRKGSEDYRILGIGIMIVSLVSFLENVYNVRQERIISEHLVIILLVFIAGSKLGDKLRIEESLSRLSSTKCANLNALVDATLFFGVGGLQISGPIALALNGDSSQLYIKSFVDIPFAFAFGAAYGKIAALSAIPVAAVQLVIVLAAKSAQSVFTQALTMQLCAMGYIVLFFSGFNLMTDAKHKISNVNMLPGLLLLICIHLIKWMVGRFV